MANDLRFKHLFERCLNNLATPEERKEFLSEVNNPTNDDLLKQLLEKSLGERLSPFKMDETRAADIFTYIVNYHKETAPVIKMKKNNWISRVAVAAALIGVCCGIGYLVIYKRPEAKETALVIKENEKEILPGGNKAILTLGDGSSIVLDSTANGSITTQANTTIIKLNNGELAYKPTGRTSAIVYNTITTPRGGQYQLMLADGSKVWLNAASSLRFPANFTGKERKVELIGEGYFEVAKNNAMPFKVSVAGKSEVEVLGTHFNINSYSDEASINTTLLEGKIRVTGAEAQNPKFILPGQQAQLNGSGRITVKDDADIDAVMAWKNGKFNFDNADLVAVMRQLARWYDVEVEYLGNVPELSFGGGMDKGLTLSQVLKLLKKSEVNFKVQGRKIIVMPNNQ